MAAQATLCPSRGRQTQTIRGICPHCGHAKEGGPPLRHRKVASGEAIGLLIAPFVARLVSD
jgi:hypothetical protein